MQTRIIEAIDQIDPDSWNSLASNDNPFIRHEFLATLEETGCASAATGWLPLHILCESAEGKLLGALPLYLKNNSYGEFVFDFAWANAYNQAGLNYYPKLVSAVPFTPATGPRLLVNAELSNATEVQLTLIEAATSLAPKVDASSLHILFPDEAQAAGLQQAGLLKRKDCQFHWHNDNYADFAEFVARFTAVKRKKVRRERRRIREAGIEFTTRSGNELTASDWEEIMPLYAATFLRRGRDPYLNKEFFIKIAKRIPDNVVVFTGHAGAELVAVAICFRSATTLYGRYWGASRFVDSLHFETCYYQGIDYCIANGLQTFEPGTQGEHKISRGFIPAETWSLHWLSRPDFAVAIDDYLGRERKNIDHYIDAVGEHVPYRGGQS
jgi:predicted N-acyltransferase